MLGEASIDEVKESEVEGALSPDLGDTTDGRTDAGRLHVQDAKNGKGKKGVAPGEKVIRT